MRTQYNTTNGSVITGKNWQYIGKFGHTVLSHIIKLRAMDDQELKMLILNTHIDIYSRTVGGVSIVNTEEGGQ